MIKLTCVVNELIKKKSKEKKVESAKKEVDTKKRTFVEKCCKGMQSVSIYLGVKQISKQEEVVHMLQEIFRSIKSVVFYP